MEEELIIETLIKEVEHLNTKLNKSIRYSEYLAETMGKIINALEKHGIEYESVGTDGLLCLNKLDPSNKLGLK